MIYYVRHGATDWNDHMDENGKLTPKFQGHADIPLNSRGLLQAQNLAKKLKNIKFDKIICSPLKRAKQTCEIITGSLDNVIIDYRIIERDFGEFEGLTRDQFDFAGFCDGSLEDSLLKAEKFVNVQQRVFELLDELKKEPNKNILIVAHGGVGCVFRSYFEGIPTNGDYSNLLVPNGVPIIKEF